VEAIGPLSCTKDGIYLAGGALSGNAYLWEVSLSNCLIRINNMFSPGKEKSKTCFTR
jgi:hypothetical protein